MAIAGRTYVGNPLKGSAKRVHTVSSKNYKDMVRHIERTGQVFVKPNVAAIAASGEMIKQSIEKSAAAAGVSSFAGRKWTGYQVRPAGGGGLNPSVIVRPRNLGATAVLNQGARPHFISARGSAVGRGAQDAAIGALESFTGRRATIRGAALKRISTRARRGQARRATVLWGPPMRHPVPYVNHPGTQGLYFVRPGFEVGRRLGLEVQRRVKFGEIIKAVS